MMTERDLQIAVSCALCETLEENGDARMQVLVFSGTRAAKDLGKKR